MNIHEIDDPYVHFVLDMALSCATEYPNDERVFGPFLVEWLRLAIARAIPE